MGGESESAGETRDYPYLPLLRRLQENASIRNHAEATVDVNNGGKDSQSENNDHQRPWDLSTDALLATLLHEFSSHVASRTHHLMSEIRTTQNSVNRVGVDVAICQTEFMKQSADIFMEQVVGDDESESDTEEEEAKSGGDNEDAEKSSDLNEQQSDEADDDSTAEIARLEAEEQSAITDGMKALALFYDPKRPKEKCSNEGGEENGEGEVMLKMCDSMTDAEEDIIGESCYYYPSAEEDVFNQRPLPFIVGSREFMESSYTCGLGEGNKQEEGGAS